MVATSMSRYSMLGAEVKIAALEAEIRKLREENARLRDIAKLPSSWLAGGPPEGDDEESRRRAGLAS